VPDTLSVTCQSQPDGSRPLVQGRVTLNCPASSRATVTFPPMIVSDSESTRTGVDGANVTVPERGLPSTSRYVPVRMMVSMSPGSGTLSS
jgi:hypothetical protein